MPPLPSYGQSADYEDFYSPQFSRTDQFGASVHTFGPNTGSIAPGGPSFIERFSIKDLSFNVQQCILIAIIVMVFYFFHLAFGDMIKTLTHRVLVIMFFVVVLVAVVLFYFLK